MDETSNLDASDYTCMLCGQTVLREGSECFDCRQARPEALRQETRTREHQGPRTLAKTITAIAAVGIAVFLVGIAGLGSPEAGWTVDLRAPVQSLASATGVGVVIGTDQGTVVSLDELSGKRRWRIAEAEGAVRGLTVRDGRVYFTIGNTGAYAVDLRTGGVVWEYHTGVICEHLAMNGDMLLLSLHDRIVAIEQETGDEAWVYLMRDGQVAGDLLARDDTAWFGFAEQNDAGEVGGGGIAALNLETRVPIWQTDVGRAVHKTPLLAIGTLIVIGESGRMFGLNARTGEIDWKHDGVTSGPVAHGEALFVARRQAFVGLDAQSGAEAWTTPHALGDCGAIVLEGGSVFFVGKREIRAVRTKTGRQRWAQEFDHDLCDVLAFGGGWMYVATKLGQVHALRMP